MSSYNRICLSNTIDRVAVQNYYGSLFFELRNIVNEYDPMDLMQYGVEDEYDPEVATIIFQLQLGLNTDQIHEIVYQEFVRWFEPVAGKRENYEQLSLAISRWLQENKARWKECAQQVIHELFVKGEYKNMRGCWNAFEFSGKQEELEKLLADWSEKYLDREAFYEYEDYYADNGKLIIRFEHGLLDNKERYFRIMRKLARTTTSVNFNATIMDSWTIDAGFTILTYRNQGLKTKRYTMTEKFKDAIERIDEFTYLYSGETFSQADIPTVLFEKVLFDHYGADTFNLDKTRE